MWAGITIIYLAIEQIFFTKEPNKHDARRISVHHTPLQKGSFGCCAVEEHVSVAFIATLICFITTLSIYKIKNKFYHRNRAVDEKLIINELGHWYDYLVINGCCCFNQGAVLERFLVSCGSSQNLNCFKSGIIRSSTARQTYP